MSKKANSPVSYGDVKYVMDIAIKKPGLIYKLATPGQAVNFKQRCNRYRNMLREQQEELYAGVPGQRASTTYDALVIRQTNPEQQPDRKGQWLIFDHQEVSGELIDPETGETIKIEMLGLFSEDDD